MTFRERLPHYAPNLSTFTCVVLSIFLAYLTPASAAPSRYPCHPVKSATTNRANCTVVRLPSSLCLSCNLRPPAPDGSFLDCNHIFDISSDSCHQALQQYVDDNPCDSLRRDALQSYTDDSNDESARSILDYFLYSICENCCDCIPMGRTASDYDALASSHTTDNPTLWKEDRGNCPAHAVYDVCNVLPDVQSFTNSLASVPTAPAACPALRSWLSSPASTSWRSNPETTITDDTRIFLRSLLQASNCENRLVWMRCHDLEDMQGTLDLPNGSTLPPVTTLPPTTTTATTTVTTTTTTTISMPSPSSSSSQSFSPSMSYSVSAVPSTAHSTGAQSVTATNSASSSPTLTQGAANSPETLDTSTAPDATNPTDEDENGIDRTTPSMMMPSMSISDEASVELGTGEATTCFPWDATVHLENGINLTMSQLQVGDRVRVSPTEFSEVFMFTHQSRFDVGSHYVELRTKMNQTLIATATHLVHINGRLMAAGKCRPGDKVLTLVGWETVVSTRRVKGSGLYNPHTLHGDIVVNNIVASTFTTAVNVRSASGLLSPLRALHRLSLLVKQIWQAFIPPDQYLMLQS